MEGTYNFYTYVYLDTRKPGKFIYQNYEFNYEPFYVGKGKGPRWIKHLQAATNLKSDSFIVRKIRKIRKETNKDPQIIKIIDNVLEEKAVKIEKLLIKSIGRLDKSEGPLVNFTEGGEGMSGYELSKEHKAKISESNRTRIISEETKRKMSVSQSNRPPEVNDKISKTKKLNWSKLTDNEKKTKNGHNKGKKLSKEQKEKISKALKGRPKPEEWKKLMSEKMLGVSKNKKVTEKHKLNLSKALTGRKLSKEHIESLKKAHKRRKDNKNK